MEIKKRTTDLNILNHIKPTAKLRKLIMAKQSYVRSQIGKSSNKIKTIGLLVNKQLYSGEREPYNNIQINDYKMLVTDTSEITGKMNQFRKQYSKQFIKSNTV